MPIIDVDGILPIPWDMLLPHEQQAQKNHYQTLGQLAEQGGLTPDEVVAILEDRSYYVMDELTAIERLAKLIRLATARLP